jgi:hypothetical protein
MLARAAFGVAKGCVWCGKNACQRLQRGQIMLQVVFLCFSIKELSNIREGPAPAVGATVVPVTGSVPNGRRNIRMWGSGLCVQGLGSRV